MNWFQKRFTKTALLLALAFAFGRPVVAQTIGFYEVASPSTPQPPIIFGNSLPTSVSFLVKNTGGSTANGVTVSMSGGNFRNFVITTTSPSSTVYNAGFANSGIQTVQNNCGGSLAASAQCTVTVAYGAALFDPFGVLSSSVQVSGSNFTTQTLTVAGWNSSTLVGQTTIYSDTSTGTTANSLVVLTTSNCPNSLPACVTTPSTSATVGAVGIATAGAGKGTLNTVQWTGALTCIADNAITANDLIIFGSTTAGDCKDSGFSSLPFTGSNSLQILGVAQASVSAGSTFTLNAGVSVQ